MFGNAGSYSRHMDKASIDYSREQVAGLNSPLRDSYAPSGSLVSKIQHELAMMERLQMVAGCLLKRSAEGRLQA